MNSTAGCMESVPLLEDYYVSINDIKEISTLAIITDSFVQDNCLRAISSLLEKRFSLALAFFQIPDVCNADCVETLNDLSDLSRDTMFLQILVVGSWTIISTIFSKGTAFDYTCKFFNWWTLLTIGNNGTQKLNSIKDCQIALIEKAGNTPFYHRIYKWNCIREKNSTYWKEVGSWSALKGLTIKEPVFETNIKKMIKGHVFKIAMEKHFPFYIPPEKSKKSIPEGLDVNLFELLHQKLKFKYQIVRPPDKRWGSLENGSWVGMIGQVFRKDADMAVGGMTVTESRMNAVSFSFYYMHDRVTFATRAPIAADRTWDIILPFSIKVWVAMIAAAFFTSAILTSIEHIFCRFTFVSQWKGQKRPKSLTYSEAFFQIYKAIVMQDSYTARRNGSRIVIATWWIFTVTVMAGYSGLLFSFMTCPRTEEPLDSIDKLVNQLKIGKYRCGTIKDSSDHNIFKGKPSEQFAVILRSMESKSKNFVKSDLEGLKKSLISNYAYIAGEITVLADMEFPAQFIFAKDSFSNSGYAIAFRKEFWFTEYFNLWIHNLYECGIIDEWGRILIKTVQKDGEPADDSPRALTFRELQGSFYVFLIGCSFALCAKFGSYIAAVIVVYLEIVWDNTVRKFLCIKIPLSAIHSKL